MTQTPPTPSPPMQPPQSPELRRKEQKMADRRRLGDDFVKAILTEPIVTLQTPPGEGEMRVWHNIPDPYKKGLVRTIVVRSIVESFWQSCIDRVKLRDGCIRYRVCAVGTPGIGKTCTTPLLLRMLLLQRFTVVFIRRSDDPASWFYEFVPTPEGKPLAVTVNVYPNSTKLEDIDSLDDDSTYYVVDPGSTEGNCNPGELLEARVIIISSPSEKHWRGGAFEKDYVNQTGLFHYYPLWGLTELQRGLDYLSPDLFPQPRVERQVVEQQLVERYRQVGGVPRHLFLDDIKYRTALERQVEAVGAINEEQVLPIVNGTLDPVGLFGPKTPKSAVIGIELADTNDFTRRKTAPVSTGVAERVFFQHIAKLWQDMVDNQRPLVFEAYLRKVLTTRRFEIRLQHDIEMQCNRTTQLEPVALTGMIGGYSGSQIVPKGTRISIAAIQNPEANILFYSADPRYELIDFVCRDNNGNILAFQATTGLDHTVNQAHIRKLEAEVGGKGGLMLFYLHTVPTFATRPIRPTTDFCQIYHVAIPRPIEARPTAEDRMIE